MIVLNFSHPLTPGQQAEIAAHVGQPAAGMRVIHVPAQFDAETSFGPQIVALADRCDLSPTEWQTAPIIVVPPALNFIAVTLLAELHGRMGYFPPMVRTSPVQGTLPPRYRIAEVMNLQAQRDAAREHR